MHPYRPLHAADERRETRVELDDDDRVLAWLLVVLGGARIVPAIVADDSFGAEATIALLMVVGGLLMLASHLWRR